MTKLKSSELFTILISTIITVIVAVGTVRYFAPQLLGISSDIQMVKTSKKVPPFFEGVFRVSDYESKDFIIPDPILKRAKPMFPDLGIVGPNDLLGFRNRGVPNIADIIIIGDSQTYGNNANLEENWPNGFVSKLNEKLGPVSHYDMAVGAWGAIEYLEVFYKSLVFKPRMVVVAFYTGNDSLGSFTTAYSDDRWDTYRTDVSLNSSDLPKVEFPPPTSDQWEVEFVDNVKTIFTPNYRLYSNDKNNVVQAGYEIMSLVAKEIADVCLKKDISIVFTIIPTKELVYKQKIENENINPPEAYTQLVTQESEYINWLENKLMDIKHAQYVSLVDVMQSSALDGHTIYPSNADGHPLDRGYTIIADHLAENVEVEWEIPNGLVAYFTNDSSYQLGLIRYDDFWVFSNTKLIESNGWAPGTVPMTVKSRDIENLKKRGFIDSIDKQKFGPP